VAGHSRQFTPGGLPDNCDTHCVSAVTKIDKMNHFDTVTDGLAILISCKEKLPDYNTV